MDFWIIEFWEALKVVVSLVTAIAAFIPYGAASHATRGERLIFCTVAGVLAFVLLPDNLARCAEIADYRQRAILAGIVAVLGAVVFIAITRQYAHDQSTLDDDKSVVRTIIGGPRLTPEATEVLAKQPRLTTQELFARLGFDPNRMWDRSSRIIVIVIHRMAALVTGLGLVAAVVCVASAVLLIQVAQRSHRPLVLEPSTAQTLLEGDRSVAIQAQMQECDPRITWSLDGPSWARSTGELGEVSAEGNYFSPLKIMRNVDVYVVATPAVHPHERRQVKIELRTHPAYGKSHRTVGTDEQGRKAKLLIEVLDQRYSWVIGKNAIQNADGAALARQMARDGIFNGVRHIICVGAASREYVSKAAEEQRAMDRAFTLANWVRSALPSRRPPLWALKVGRYDEEGRLGSIATASERQVVIVGVLEADSGVDMLAALRDAFEQKRAEAPVLGKYLDRYPFENWRLVSMK